MAPWGHKQVISRVLTIIRLLLGFVLISIISMTKLLDANWLRGIQLYLINNCTAVQLMILPKQTKWRKATFTRRNEKD